MAAVAMDLGVGDLPVGSKSAFVIGFFTAAVLLGQVAGQLVGKTRVGGFVAAVAG